MDTTVSTRAALRRFLQTGFTARDIAESLVSMDASRDAADVRTLAESRGFGTVGVRIDGEVVGYARREDLNSGRLADAVRYFGTDEIIEADATLAEVILRLEEAPRLYVVILGAAGGIISPGDLQKAPVRMWLFGLITLIEQLYRRLLVTEFPGDRWQEHLSPQRLERARSLQTERQRRKQTATLIDCLAFADAAGIVYRKPEILERSPFESRNEAKDAIKRFELLRNALAHANDLIPEHRLTIHQLARGLDRILLALDRAAMLRSDDPDA